MACRSDARGRDGVLAADPRPRARFAQFFDSVAAGSLASRIKLYPFDISPTSDDKPFFFDIWRYGRADTWRSPHVIALRNMLGLDDRARRCC